MGWQRLRITCWHLLNLSIVNIYSYAYKIPFISATKDPNYLLRKYDLEKSVKIHQLFSTYFLLKYVKFLPVKDASK
jgi:hypothetical protein